MANTSVTTKTGPTALLLESVIEEFKSSLRGLVLQPGDETYDDVRQVWNRLIDRRPAILARCAGVSDIINCVDFARANHLLVSVRGGGHNIAGSGVCDGGLMIDLSLMKSVRVDPARRTARAEPGLNWGEFDHETQAFGLATTGGVVSMTGIAGLTLGGGIGWIMGKCGLTCDNLLSCDIVTADGKLIRASAEENPDLLWGLRGGGGNFGIVTSFEYQLHPVGPTVLGGAIVHPFSQAKELLKFYREYIQTTPDELTTTVGIITSPEGDPVISISVCYAGPIEKGEQVLGPLREFGHPLVDQIGPMPYMQVQSARDAKNAPGPRHYWKDNFLTGISDAAIDVIVEWFSAVPSKQTAVILVSMRGAVGRVPRDETAFYHRDMAYELIILSAWNGPSDSEKNIRWTDDFLEAFGAELPPAVYVNDLGDEGETRIRDAYGGNYKRLAALKNKFDPSNFFRVNQNIKPTV